MANLEIKDGRDMEWPVKGGRMVGTLSGQFRDEDGSDIEWSVER